MHYPYCALTLAHNLFNRAVAGTLDELQDDDLLLLLGQRRESPRQHLLDLLLFHFSLRLVTICRDVDVERLVSPIGAEVVDDVIVRYAIKPCREGVALPPVLPDLPPSFDEYLLREVLRCFSVVDLIEHVSVDSIEVDAVNLSEGLDIAGGGPLNQDPDLVMGDGVGDLSGRFFLSNQITNRFHGC